MPSTPDRHRRRRLSLRGEARLSGDKLTQAQVDLLMSKIAETPCNPAHLEAVTKAENLRRRQCRDAVPLAFAWRAARDAALNLAHLVSIEAES